MLAIIRKYFSYIAFVIVVLPVLIVGFIQSEMSWYLGIGLFAFAGLLYLAIILGFNWIFNKILKS